MKLADSQEKEIFFQAVENLLNNYMRIDLTKFRKNDEEIFEKLSTYDLNEIKDSKLNDKYKLNLLKLLIIIDPNKCLGENKTIENFVKINGEFCMLFLSRLLKAMKETIFKKNAINFFKFSLKLIDRAFNNIEKMSYKEINNLQLNIRYLVELESDLNILNSNDLDVKEKSEEINRVFPHNYF